MPNGTALLSMDESHTMRSKFPEAWYGNLRYRICKMKSRPVAAGRTFSLNGQKMDQQYLVYNTVK